MTRLPLIICVICGFTNLCCSQLNRGKNFSKVEVNPNLNDDFFNSRAYSQTPSSMKTYRNDTLILDTTYALITKKEVNAFLEDRYNKKFSFNECFGKVVNDTMTIEFRDDLIEGCLLSIEIFKGYFKSNFTETSTKANNWTTGKERLVLDNMNFKDTHEVKGRLEIEFLLIDDGVTKDSAFFQGPFYFKVSVPPVVRTVPAQ